MAGARRARRSGPGVPLVVSSVVLAAAAGFLWLRGGPHAAPAAGLPSLAESPPAAAPAAAEGATDSRAVVAELTQLAPELTPASAEMLMGQAPNASGQRFNSANAAQRSCSTAGCD